MALCLGLPEATHPKEDTEDQKGGQSFTKEDKKEDVNVKFSIWRLFKFK